MKSIDKIKSMLMKSSIHSLAFLLFLCASQSGIQLARSWYIPGWFDAELVLGIIFLAFSVVLYIALAYKNKE